MLLICLVTVRLSQNNRNTCKRSKQSGRKLMSRPTLTVGTSQMIAVGISDMLDSTAVLPMSLENLGAVSSYSAVTGFVSGP